VDVVAEAAELMRLARRDAAIRVQHHHADPRLPMEGSGHRRAGIARGRHHDRQRALAPLLQPGKTGRKEARTEIRERRRGAMEQLQHMVIGGCQRAQRRIEIEGLRAEFGQHRFQGIVLEVRCKHCGRGLREARLR